VPPRQPQRPAEQVERIERGQGRDGGLGHVPQHVVVTGQRSLHRPGGEVLRRDTEAQQRSRDRSGRGAHDHVGGARVEAEVVLEDGEHA
jgi:hypothetical protein